MNRAFLSRVIAATALAVGAFGVAAAAHAQPDIRVFVDLPARPAILPPPLVVRTQPVFDRREPVYVQPPVRHEHGARTPYRAEFGRERGVRHAEWERQQWQRREWERREWQRREWERRHHDHSSSHGRGWN